MDKCGGTATNQRGCGKIIKWSEMTAVTVPSGFLAEEPTATRDIKPLLKKQRKKWRDHYNKSLGGLKILDIQKVKKF